MYFLLIFFIQSLPLTCLIYSFLYGYAAYLTIIRRTVQFGRLERKAVVSVVLVLDAGCVVGGGKYVYDVFLWSPYVHDK